MQYNIVVVIANNEIKHQSSRLSRSLEVIGTDTDRSAATCYLLLTFRSNRFRDDRRFRSKNAFSHAH